VRLAVTGLELVNSITDLAREGVKRYPEIAIESGDLFELAATATRFDYVTACAAGLVLGNTIVRHDAPASVRRAFRRSELDQLARQAGLDYLAAREEPWFRVSLAGEKPDAW
jgi:hypothetical protein